MLKTNPKWMRWNNGGKLDTSSSRNDEQSGSKGADVKSAPEQSNMLSNYVPIKKESIQSKDTEDTPLHFKTGDVATKLNKVNQKFISKELSDKANDIKQKVISSNSSRIVPSNKRNSDVPKTEKDWNFEESKMNVKRNWKLSNYNVNTYKSDKSYKFENLKNRKLSSTLSLLFSKIAEERMGDKIEGTDKWDVNKIMFRRVSKKLITNCKYTREKERLVLLLDSSPSCARMANTYSQISTEACRYEDVELYDAPNGYLHSVYDSRTKKYRRLTDDEIKATLYWSAFDGRTVIYFGDEDAYRNLERAWKYCDLHWFYKSYGTKSDYLTERQRKRWEGKLSVHKCNNVDELIQAVRSMK